MYLREKNLREILGIMFTGGNPQERKKKMSECPVGISDLSKDTFSD